MVMSWTVFLGLLLVHHRRGNHTSMQLMQLTSIPPSHSKPQSNTFPPPITSHPSSLAEPIPSQPSPILSPTVVSQTVPIHNMPLSNYPSHNSPNPHARSLWQVCLLHPFHILSSPNLFEVNIRTWIEIHLFTLSLHRLQYCKKLLLFKHSPLLNGESVLLGRKQKGANCSTSDYELSVETADEQSSRVQWVILVWTPGGLGTLKKFMLWRNIFFKRSLQITSFV